MNIVILDRNIHFYTIRIFPQSYAKSYAASGGCQPVCSY